MNYILNGECGGQTLKWKAVLTWSPVSFQRRSYSLDVEVSASGFTKDMERDGALLHPAGPEDDDDNDEEEEDDDDDHEDAKEATDEEREEAVDMEEYKHAMLELEGLRISETPAETQDEDSEKSKNKVEDQVTETASSPPGDEETEKQLDEELEEAEDEVPELADLSASNKEFKPFR